MGYYILIILLFFNADVIIRYDLGEAEPNNHRRGYDLGEVEHG